MTTVRNDFHPPLTRATSDPDFDRLAAVVARLYVEIEAGRRPASQLDRAVSPALRRRLRLVAVRRRDVARRQRRTPAGPGATVVLRATSSRPREHAVESAVVVQVGDRVRAVCARFERHHGAWRVVELATPDSGDRPRRTASCPAARPRRDVFDEVLDAVDDACLVPDDEDDAVEQPEFLPA